MILRPSLKLARKLHESNMPVLAPAASLFLDWHATMFTYFRYHYVLVVNSRSLFSVLLPGAGITSRQTLVRAWMPQLGEMLERMGAQVIFERIILPGLYAVAVSKATDRRVIGSMKEIVFSAKLLLGSGDTSPYDLSLRLNERIYSYTNGERPSRVFPAMTQELPEIEDPRIKGDPAGRGRNCQCAKKSLTPSSPDDPSPS